MKVRWRHSWIGWIGAAALVTYVIATSDLAGFVQTVSAADPWVFLLAAAVAGPVAFALDATGMHVLLRGAGVPLPFGEAVRLRGVSSLLNIVNYNLGLAAIAAVLARRTRRSGAEAAGFALTLGLLDLWALAVVALAGLLFGAVGMPREARTLLIALAATGVVAGPAAWLAARSLGRSARPGSLVGDVVASLHRLRPSSAGATALLRGAMVLTYVASDWAFLQAFRFDVPVTAAMAGLPVVYLASALPIAVGGFGSGQVAMRWVFQGWAPAGVSAVAAVDAVSTSALSAVLLMRLSIGLACLPWALRALRNREMTAGHPPV